MPIQEGNLPDRAVELAELRKIVDDLRSRIDRADAELARSSCAHAIPRERLESARLERVEIATALGMEVGGDVTVDGITKHVEDLRCRSMAAARREIAEALELALEHEASVYDIVEHVHKRCDVVRMRICEAIGIPSSSKVWQIGVFVANIKDKILRAREVLAEDP